MRQWTQKEREHQAALIQKWKPWLSSTGPRTIDGKKQSSKNSLMHGYYTQHAKFLREQVCQLLESYKSFTQKI